MKTLGRLLMLAVVLVLIGATVFYERPLWVDLQWTHLSLFLTRVQSNYVMTPEGRVHYYEAEARIPGGGVPLVLVHGLGDRAESWAPMLKRLKRDGFHVYAPDLLGYGRSPKPTNSDYSISTQEKFVADFIQSVGLQRPEVGGWSMGGWIVLKLALDHPEMVNRTVVYDSAGLRQQIPGGVQVFRPETEAEMQRLVSLLEPGTGKVPSFVLKAELRKFAQEQWVVDRGLQSMELGNDLVSDRLGKMTEPLLIVWGSDDELLPISVGELMHKLDPRSELDIVEGCGHLAPKTCSLRVASATADFLKSNPAPEGGLRTLAATH
jgi:pimeloyl-ACP methyl ester carboxylesterase